MAPNHALLSPSRDPAPDSYATHCSLRGGHAVHPLKQNPPSISEAAEEADGELAHFDDVDIHAESVYHQSGPTPRPPPSAYTPASSSSTAYSAHDHPSPLEDYPPRLGQRHQRSLTANFLDNGQSFLNKATSTLQQHTSRAALHSPTKSLASFIPSRTVLESTASQPKIRAGAKALQNWFNGSSGPVSLGIARDRDGSDDSDGSDDYDSQDEGEDEGDMIGIFTRGPALTGSSDSTPTKQTTPKPARPQTQSSNASSRFAWLLNAQKNASVPPPMPSPTYHDPSDELLDLNISQSLFPHGPVDPLAPSSFHDLLTTAESLLSRYQTSYRQLSSTVNDMRAEQSAQVDELDEAETRVRHLKMQLETMAARATEQDGQMRKLMEDLSLERRARQEEELARKRSLALICGSAGVYPTTQVQNLDQEAPKRKNRVSNSDISVDSGFESECDSEAPSIFSRTNCLSPTDTIPSSASILSIPVSPMDQHDATPKSKPRPQNVQRRSTYDQVRDGTIEKQKRGWGCANCEGGAQSAVWGRLAKEREESSILRRRIEVLEEAVEGALNVVDGPWGI